LRARSCDSTAQTQAARPTPARGLRSASCPRAQLTSRSRGQRDKGGRGETGTFASPLRT
jgi:hypothetical protein